MGYNIRVILRNDECLLQSNGYIRRCQKEGNFALGKESKNKQFFFLGWKLFSEDQNRLC